MYQKARSRDVGRHAVAPQVDPDRARRHAQHRDADRKERQVVPRNDRQDAGLDDLKDEHREGDEEHTSEELRTPKNREQMCCDYTGDAGATSSGQRN